MQPEQPGQVNVYRFKLRVEARGGAYAESEEYTLKVGCVPDGVQLTDPLAGSF